MSLATIERVFLRADYLLGAAIIICQLFGYQSLTSAFFYATFFVSALLWVCTMLEKITRIDALAMAIMVVALVCVLVNSSFDKAVVSFEYMKKYIMLCCTLAFFSAACKMRIGKRTVDFIGLTYVVVGLFFVFAYVTRKTQMYAVGGVVSNYLTFLFTNPNLTGLFLACMVMFFAIRAVEDPNTIARVAFLILAAIEMYFLYQTQSRNSMLAVAIFFAVYISVHVFSGFRARIPRWLFAVVAAFPLAFALIYLACIEIPAVSNALSFFSGEGKSLGSRLRIWSNALPLFFDSPVFGAYSQASNGVGMSQLHNTHIDILVSYGFVVLLLVIFFLYAILNYMQANGLGRARIAALVGFSCALLLGSGEAALFSGGMGIYLYAGVFLILASEASDGGSDGLLKTMGSRADHGGSLIVSSSAHSPSNPGTSLLCASSMRSDKGKEVLRARSVCEQLP